MWFVLAQSMVLATPPPTTMLDPNLKCRAFQDIYSSGKDLCERIFGDAFLYIPRANTTEYNMAYTMWWFDSVNPNDAVTRARQQQSLFLPGYNTTDTCWLQTDGVTNHKNAPFAEGLTFTECLPYRQNACCKETTVENASTINALYGAEYRWDRCGKLSEECERFFVQESCLYECDPNAGLYRKYSPLDVLKDPSLAPNAWELFKMPIKGDYCDAWFDACRAQLFCGDGDFFSCARIPPPPLPVYNLSPGAIAGIVIGSVVLFITCVFLIVLIRNERRGTPVFQKIDAEDSQPLKSSNPTNQVAGATQRQNEITTI